MSLELKFVIAVLACFRIAELISIDDGPRDLILSFRLWVARHSQEFSKLISCPFCTGLWLAIPLGIWLGGTTIEGFLFWLAVAGGQSVLQGRQT